MAIPLVGTRANPVAYIVRTTKDRGNAIVAQLALTALVTIITLNVHQASTPQVVLAPVHPVNRANIQGAMGQNHAINVQQAGTHLPLDQHRHPPVNPV